MSVIARPSDQQDTTRSSKACTRSMRRRNYWSDNNPACIARYPKSRPLGYLKQLDLIRRAQRGDLHALRTVWVHNARLVMSVANQRRVPVRLLDDAMQEGTLGSV